MIKLLVFDVDGTLSDGKVYYTQSGDEMKAFDIKDGLAISVWNNKLKLHSAIISGRKSQLVESRATELGISHIFMGVENKLEVLKSLLKTLDIKASEAACIGDDLNDLAMFKLCKYSFLPKDGAKAMRKYATKILKHKGGSGAVREMIEIVLKHNGETLEQYFI